MISFLGWNSSQTILAKALPNEPVPPVTSTVLPLRSARGLRKSRMPTESTASRDLAAGLHYGLGLRTKSSASISGDYG